MKDALFEALDSNDEGVIVADAERVIALNSALCRITGYSKDELTGLPSLVALMSPEEREANAERLRRRLRGERVPDHYTMTVVAKDGTMITLEVAIRRIPSSAGSRVLAVGRRKS